MVKPEKLRDNIYRRITVMPLSILTRKPDNPTLKPEWY